MKELWHRVSIMQKNLYAVSKMQIIAWLKKTNLSVKKQNAICVSRWMIKVVLSQMLWMVFYIRKAAKWHEETKEIEK